MKIQLPEYIQIFMTDLKNKGAKLKTYSNYKQDFLHFDSWLISNCNINSYSSWAQLSPREYYEYYLFNSKVEKNDIKIIKRRFFLLKNMIRFYKEMKVNVSLIKKATLVSPTEQLIEDIRKTNIIVDNEVEMQYRNIDYDNKLLIMKSSLPDFITEYLISLSDKGKKKSTLKRYIYDLEMYKSWFTKEFDAKQIEYTIWKDLSLEHYASFYHYLVFESNNGDRSIKRIFVVLQGLINKYKLGEERVDLKEIESLYLIAPQGKELTSKDIIFEREVKTLYDSIDSDKGLSKRQIPTRPYIRNRNKAIIMLFCDFGLTLSEMVNLNIGNLNLIRDEITLKSSEGKKRVLPLRKKQRELLKNYLEDIPIPVRPKEKHHPFFVAFDVNRNTFTWNYDENSPKRLSEVSIQRQIKRERDRAGVRETINPTTMRNRCIVNAIINGIDREKILSDFSLQSEMSLKRYTDYARKLSDHSIT